MLILKSSLRWSKLRTLCEKLCELRMTRLVAIRVTKFHGKVYQFQTSQVLEENRLFDWSTAIWRYLWIITHANLEKFSTLAEVAEFV